MEYKRPHIKLVIVTAVCNYLNTEQVEDLKKQLGRRQKWDAAALVKLLSNYFDFERLRTNPLIQEDVWLYNYLAYECPTDRSFKFVQQHFTTVPLRFRRTKLFRKYEDQVILPQLIALKDVERILSN